MPNQNASVILLRRVDYGDWDLIITFLSRTRGKMATIAKAAKKSTKRFGGVLELFSALDIVFSVGRKKGLPVLQEATIVNPFSSIRSDIHKTAYASYWAEMVNIWMEEGGNVPDVYHLLYYALESLNDGRMQNEAVSILFQLRFMMIAGFTPNLDHCILCDRTIDDMGAGPLMFDLSNGGIACNRCMAASSRMISLHKGTVKQLQWVNRGSIEKAGRVRFTPQAVREGLALLEAFGPYHLGKKPRSLTFLQQLR